MSKRLSETPTRFSGLDATIPTERELENWMNYALKQLDIGDVQVSYTPDATKQPLGWFPDLGLLIIHDPDPYEAGLTFLKWVPGELLRQLHRVIENTEDIARIKGRRSAVTFFRDYRRKMEALAVG